MIRNILLNNNNGNLAIVSALQHHQAHQNESAFYSIKFVLTGKEIYHVHEKTHEVTSGNYLVANCGKKYDVVIDSKEDVNGLCLFIHEGFLQDVYVNMNKKEDFLLDQAFGSMPSVEIDEMVYSPRHNLLGNFLQSLYFNFQDENKTGEFDSANIFYFLSCQLLMNQKRISDHYNELEVRKKSTAAELFQRLAMGKNMIDEEPEKDWSMRELSRSVALSEFHFFRTFKKAFKMSPYQYLIRQRIEKASGLLRKSSFPLAEIAFKSGFADIYAFSKAFKKYKGVSPSSFRNSYAGVISGNSLEA
jgi:AraC family transcriptional regulator